MHPFSHATSMSRIARLQWQRRGMRLYTLLILLLRLLLADLPSPLSAETTTPRLLWQEIDRMLRMLLWSVLGD